VFKAVLWALAVVDIGFTLLFSETLPTAGAHLNPIASLDVAVRL